MNIFEIRDIAHAIMDLLPDIRVLRVSRALDDVVQTHADYAIWQKCTGPADIYKFGLPKMLTGPHHNGFFIAAIGGNTRMLSHLSGKVNIALVLAVKNGHLDAVKFLIDAGADIHIHSSQPILLAYAGGHIAVVKFLIECGVVYRKCKALDSSAANGQLESIKFLIESGVDIGDDLHSSALMSAIRYKSLNIIEWLLDNAADVRLLGDQPLIMACINGSLDVVKLLIARGASVKSDQLAAACMHGHLEIVKFLVSAGADINPANQVPLISAVDHGKWDIVEFLLVSGAQFFCKTESAAATVYR